MSNNKKDLTVTEQLVVDHCEQVIEFAKETERSLADHSQRKRLADLRA